MKYPIALFVLAVALGSAPVMTYELLHVSNKDVQAGTAANLVPDGISLSLDQNSDQDALSGLINSDEDIVLQPSDQASI